MAKLFHFKGPDGREIILSQVHQAYFVKRQTKEGFFTKTTDSFSYGRLSHAITKYWDMVGEYIEQQYNHYQEGGN